VENAADTRLRAISEGNHVIVLQSEIIESRGVAVPAGRIGPLDANNVRRRSHVDAPLSHRPIDQTDFEFNGRADFEFARRQKIDSARTDIARHQRDWKVYANTGHGGQPQRQRQFGSRVTPVFPGHANGVSGNASEAPGPRFAGKSSYAGGQALEVAQRRDNDRLCKDLCSSPHVHSPRTNLSAETVGRGLQYACVKHRGQRREGESCPIV
jgi:hypothetical protein